MKFVQVLKWAGALDGAVMAGAVTFAEKMPQYAPTVLLITAIGGAFASALGVIAHVTAGSQTVTVEQAKEQEAANAAKAAKAQS